MGRIYSLPTDSISAGWTKTPECGRQVASLLASSLKKTTCCVASIRGCQRQKCRTHYRCDPNFPRLDLIAWRGCPRRGSSTHWRKSHKAAMLQRVEASGTWRVLSLATTTTQAPSTPPAIHRESLRSL